MVDVGVIDLVLKFMQGVLNGLDCKELARFADPRESGERVARFINRLFVKHGTPEGTVNVPVEAIVQLAREEPDTFGTVFALLCPDQDDAEGQRHQVLECYASVLNFIADFVIGAKSSLVLRGFLHDSGCISYWHLKEASIPPRRMGARDGSVRIAGDVEIYLLLEEPTVDRLHKLNTAIRQARTRTLLPEDRDYRTNEQIALVREVFEEEILVSRLDPDRTRKMRQARQRADPRDIQPGTQYKLPIDFALPIPLGAPAIGDMVESLPAAIQVQREHVTRIAETMRAVESIARSFTASTRGVGRGASATGER